MARFKYLGEPPRDYVVTYGPTTAIKIKKHDGSVQTLTPVDPAVEFAVNADIGYEITDSRALRQLRADTRFEEI